MPHLNRRRLMGNAAAVGSLAVLGDLSFLSALPPVSAAEAEVRPERVHLRPEIEPLVRLIEDTPRDRLLEAAAVEVRKGTPYPQLLTALMLAGVRGIKPRPVGFKFHAVLVLNSAHMASLASPESDRWLPLFWALDAFKSSQSQNTQQGDWHMPALKDGDLPPPDQARRRFIDAMDRWDVDAADVAAAQFARVGKPSDVYELVWRYGARDFRDLGHKAIYAANSWRTLKTIGWQHAEPVLRSLSFALLDRETPYAKSMDSPLDHPWSANVERARKVRPGWLAAHPRKDEAARYSAALLSATRTGTSDEAAESAVGLLNAGAGPDACWDGIMLAAGELLSRQPGIVGIHSVTSANALRFAAQTTRRDETHLLLLLQAAGFMSHFRKTMEGRGAMADSHLDTLTPDPMKTTGPAVVEEIFATVGSSRSDAARKTLAYLESGGEPEALMASARRLIFLKGTDAHDYKFSSAALEDYRRVGPVLRNRYLAAAMFNLRGSGDRDNDLVVRAREALKG